MAVEKDTCSNCSNFKICKFKEDYEELGQQAAANLDVKEPFKVVLVCPYFSRFSGFNPGTVYRDDGGNTAVCRDLFTPPGACAKE